MNEPERHDQEEASTGHNQATDAPGLVESRISRALHNRASQISFSPQQRAQVMQKLPAHRPLSMQRRLLPAFSLAAAILIILSIATYVVSTQSVHAPAPTASIIFVMDKTFGTPSQLAQGGQPVLLDPTGQHIVYGLAKQAGVMYTTDLADPIASNLLAMQYARDVSWSPDGSALVTTIFPPAVTTPLLALVQTGQYMHTLGIEALAAAWLPTSTSTITYITQTNGQATLWEITPDGKNAHSIGAMSLPAFAQSLRWSSDGRYLAIVGDTGNAPTRELLQGPGKAIFLYDMHTGTLTNLALAGNASVTSVLWSPGGDTFTYALTDAAGHTTLNAINVSPSKTLFSIALQHQLMGMSWSPDGRALVYSDGGHLFAHILNGKSLVFSNIPASATYPLWQDNQHILYLSISNGAGQLAQLAANASALTASKVRHRLV